MKSRRGFTLIELLVVVAIIAVLIAILLPSLGRAKMLAKRTVCLTNMKAIGQATRAYASGNEDLLPEVSGASTNFAQALLSTYTVDTSVPALVQSTSNAGVGLGRLLATGYLSDIRVAWCPTQPNASFNTDPGNVLLPWPTHFTSGNLMYRSSYNYQPNHGPLQADGITYPVAYRKLSQYPEFLPAPSTANPYAGLGEFLAIDVIQNNVEMAHVDNNGTPMWNAVWSDGHAASIKAPGIVTQLNSTGVSKYWANFDKPMGILISQAAAGQTTN